MNQKERRLIRHDDNNKNNGYIFFTHIDEYIKIYVIYFIINAFLNNIHTCHENETTTTTTTS